MIEQTVRFTIIVLVSHLRISTYLLFLMHVQIVTVCFFLFSFLTLMDCIGGLFNQSNL